MSAQPEDTMADLGIVERLRAKWEPDFKLRFGLINPDGPEAADLIAEMAAALERIRRGKRVNWDGANYSYEALDGDAAREIARAAIAKLGDKS